MLLHFYKRFYLVVLLIFAGCMSNEKKENKKLSKAVKLGSKGDVKNAIIAYEDYLKTEDNPNAEFVLATLYHQEKRYDKEIEILRIIELKKNYMSKSASSRIKALRNEGFIK